MDSGAFSLLAASGKAGGGEAGRRKFYDSPDFFAYMDEYADFVKNHNHAIDYYANVDAIGIADLTWRNQQYLEKKGLTPVPVVHYGSDLKWLRHYLDRDYEYIGLGGLVGNSSKDECRRWVDRCFEMVCPAPSYLPTVKLHGFGVTGYNFMIRYPWYSVDSASWTKIGANGGILVPHKRGGTFTFGVEPYQMQVSADSPAARQTGKHYYTLTDAEQKIIREWLEFIDVPLGKGFKVDKDREPLKPGDEPGVVNHHSYRKVANLLFFEKMREWLDGEKGPWPWPFKTKVRRGWFPC